jgi:hypothetical protein
VKIGTEVLGNAVHISSAVRGPHPRRPLWPVAVAVALLLGTVSALLFISLQRTGGRLIYALDDPYIHMAMAKNAAVALLGNVRCAQRHRCGELSGDIDVVDMVGLASLDVARLRRAGTYTSDDLEEVTPDHGVRIAIVYDRWFQRNLPTGWLKAGSWKIRNAVVVGSDTVSFYASGPEEYGALVNHLREFQSELPPGVASTLTN